MKVVIAESVTDKLEELIKEHGKDWTVYSDQPKNKAELIERLKDAEVAASYSTKYDDEIFSSCPNLKYIAIPSVGANYFVDMEAAQQHGVTVMNCPGYNAPAVAELAIGLAIDVLRGISQKNHDLQEGRWNPEHPLGTLIRGKHLGFIGYGNVGKMIDSMLAAWGTSSASVRSRSTADEVDALMSSADIIFVCCPQTPKTEGLVSAERLAMMQPGSIIINVSRGAIIDEDALYETLKNGKIAGAGLDVFVNENRAGQEVPANIMRFVSLPNVVCTPHTAGTATESRLVLSQMIFDNLESAEAGTPINIYTD